MGLNGIVYDTMFKEEKSELLNTTVLLNGCGVFRSAVVIGNKGELSFDSVLRGVNVWRLRYSIRLIKCSLFRET